MTYSMKLVAAATAALAFSSLPVLAQSDDFKMPDQCATAAAAGGMDHSMMGHDGMSKMMDMMGMGGNAMDSMPKHVQQNMQKMMVTMPAMHQGMLIEDPDVAFACGMIAHHQGALDMAKVLLENGDDPQMRALAEQIIAAQLPEIEQMTKWLAEHAQ